MKILILWPSGSVEQSRSGPVVRRKVFESVTEDMNRGDLFVHEATLRTLDYDYMEEVRPTLDEITEEVYAYYNTSFDYLVIRGSNYIRNDGNLGEWLPFFRRIEIPILAFGIGAQAPSADQPEALQPDVVEALHEIARKSVHSIGVRGEYTRALLAGLGIRNVTAIGCPSIFRERNPDLKISWQPARTQKLAFTTHPYLAGLYTRNVWNSRVLQTRLIGKLRAAGYQLAYLTQGIAAETKIAYDKDAESGVHELREIGWFGEDEGFVEDFRRHAVCFETGDDYYRFSATCDLNIGTRLHGNITALAMGRPAIFVTYDTRTAELAELFSIPTLSEDLIGEDFAVEDFLNKVSFASFNRKFRHRYNAFVRFLDDNKVTHRMRDKVAA
ncbi:polysaccharide pyruvyl transferase family protein [Massilia sp. 9I]|uniref:polysaccharide pyruvyl transferase family protein n=1 Tax=Massilia sp. 9I TaxID=2653152 RepID=UPI0012F2F3F7|nr:polysaccharide pyruvyl transferase family protein [Massilia sp. 9I]VXC66146.1 putative Polysaccharide pyruvyl transferase [Massilia sp. 9I]